MSLPGTDPPKQDSGLHFNRLAVLLIRFEFPLAQGITDRLSLIVKSTEKVNVLHLAFFTVFTDLNAASECVLMKDGQRTWRREGRRRLRVRGAQMAPFARNWRAAVG